jgi:hypothetical protein
MKEANKGLLQEKDAFHNWEQTSKGLRCLNA